MQQIGLIEMAGAAAFACYLLWLVVFMQWVRPRLMGQVGRALGANVHESYGATGWAGAVLGRRSAGLYEADASVPLGTRALVGLADVTMLLVCLLGPLATLGLTAFHLADTGQLYRWEGQVTGTAVRITSVTAHDMHDRRATVDLLVENIGAAPATACAGGKAEYRAADGYVTVSPRSEWFDLAPGASRTLTLHLRAQRTVVGVHPLRLWVACGDRRKDQVQTTLRVTG